MAREPKQWVVLRKIFSSTRCLTLPVLLLVLVCPLALASNVHAAGASLTVTDGNPQFSADEINPGQYTTAHFEVIPFAGTADPEGNSPTITGESFEVTVDSQTTITGVSVVWNGAVVNVTYSNSAATIEDFNITGSIPTSTFQVDVTVRAGQNASTGEHPVTLTGISIQTSKGEGYGNPDTEDFEVEVLAVDITGPPYVITDNGRQDLAANPPYGYPPDSTYTAYATGGSGSYKWRWGVSSNIMLDNGVGGNYSYSKDNPIYVFGVGPIGPGEIWCEATDTTTGSIQYGNRHPFVHDEFVKDWESEIDGPASESPPSYGANLVGDQQTALAGQGTTVTVNAGSTTEFSVGISVGGDISGANLGLDVGMSQASESGSSSPVPCPANPAQTYWEGVQVPMVNTVKGTGYKYGPSGIVDQEKITEVKKASPLADAEEMSGPNTGSLAITPAPESVTPVSP